MVTIERLYDAGDGWDVQIAERAEPYHFTVKPADVQNAVDTAHAAWLAAVAAEPVPREPTAKEIADSATDTLIAQWPALAKADRDRIKALLNPLVTATAVEAI